MHLKIVQKDFLNGLKDPVGIVVAPTNGIIGKSGLVMGAGAAKALASSVQEIQQAFAKEIERQGKKQNNCWIYGFVIAYDLNFRIYGAFQTKTHFKDLSNLNLISLSSQKLAIWLEKNPGWRIHMAFPGIGLGGLSPDSVLEVLEKELYRYSDRVVLYKK